MAFLNIGTSCIALVMIIPWTPRMRVKVRRFIDWSALTSGPFLALMRTGFFNFAVYYISIVYLSTAGEQMRLKANLVMY